MVLKDFTNGPAPGFWRMFWNCGGALAIFVGVFTIGLSIGSFYNLRLGLAFETRGVEATAQVVAREARRVSVENGTKTEYFVTILYDTPDSQERKERRVSRALYDQSTGGAQRPIRYLSDAPGTFEFEIGETWSSGQTMRWIALVLGLVTLGAIWWRGGVAVAAIRARKYGASEDGVVVEVKRRRRKHGSHYTLVWRDAHGAIGTSLPSGNPRRYEPYPPHSRIALFRGARGEAWWIGDVGPRAAARPVPDVARGEAVITSGHRPDSR